MENSRIDSELDRTEKRIAEAAHKGVGVRLSAAEVFALNMARMDRDRAAHKDKFAALRDAKWLYHCTMELWHKPDRSTRAMTTDEAYALLKAGSAEKERG